jgi:hypothetical protein
MKAVFPFAVIVFLSSISYAQTDTSVIGTWKIVSVKMADIYFNFNTDSISLPNEVRDKYSDKAEQKKLIDNVSLLFSNTKFQFEKNGNLRGTLMGEVFNGSYRIMPTQNIIELTEKNSLHEDVTDKVKYNLKNGLLNLIMNLDDGEIDLVLKKE